MPTQLLNFWQSNTVYPLGTFIFDGLGDIQQVTTAGVSGPFLPAWNSQSRIGGSPPAPIVMTQDGSVVWTLVGLGSKVIALQRLQDPIGPYDQHLNDAVSVSRGVIDAGKFVVLNAAGQLDASMGGGGGGSGSGVSSFNGRIGVVIPQAGDYTYSQISGTPQLPQTFAAQTHKFLNSYTASTGLFTAAQPTVNDISASGTPSATTFLRGDGSWVSAVQTLEISGTPNSSQSLLNLIPGTGIGITDGGSGAITVSNLGVLSVNGETGNITIVGAGSAAVSISGSPPSIITVTGPLFETNGIPNLSQTILSINQSSGISVTNPSGGTVAIANTGVLSLNSLTGALSITAGAGISVTPSNPNIAIANTGVLAITSNGSNPISGTVNLAAGSGVTLSPSGQGITIASTGGSVAGQGVQGVKTITTNYTAGSVDTGFLLSFNGVTGSPPTGLTLTLPNPPPSLIAPGSPPTAVFNWWIAVENVNATAINVNTNGLKLDGVVYPSGSPPVSFTIPQNQGLWILTDGTNYFTCRGMGGGGVTSLTAVAKSPSLVNFSAGGSQNGPFATATSAAQNITAGNSIVVAMRWGASAVTDTAGNTYTQLAFLPGNPGSGDGCQFWYANNVKGNAANVVTATLPAGSLDTFTYIAVWQIAGGPLIFDAQFGNVQTAANANMVSSAIVTAYANEIAFVIGQSYTSLRTYTPGTGWTQDGGSSLAGNQIASAEHRITTQSGTSATMTDSGSDPYQMFACAFITPASISIVGSFEGQQGYCINGLKLGETSGAGTGVPVYWSNGFWRVSSRDVPVSA